MYDANGWGMPEVVVPGGRIRLTASQLRMARAALRWDRLRLAAESGVSERTIRRIESAYGAPNVWTDTLDKLQAAFEAEGIVFLPETGEEGPGVRSPHSPDRSVTLPESSRRRRR